MPGRPDYYAVLGVAPDADERAIREAFRQLARRYHPDVKETGSLERMREINEAYQVLSDPGRRRDYDLSRPAPAPTATRTTAQESPPPSARRSRPSRPHGTRRSPHATYTAGGPLSRVASLGGQDPTPVAALALTAVGEIAVLGQLDGRLTVWDVPVGRLRAALRFEGGPAAGALRQVRVSPSGAYVAAWGYPFGLHAWRTEDAAVLLNTGMGAPSGLMDAAVTDDPAALRLALPEAPSALAEDDPFAWAERGRRGTDIFTRPLSPGMVAPTAAVPMRCAETGGKLLRYDDEAWRIHLRVLSTEGRWLLTFSTGRTTRLPRSQILHLWDLDARTLLGAPEPKRLTRISEPEGTLGFPIAATPDLDWGAVTDDAAGRVRVYALRGEERHDIRTGPFPPEAQLALAPAAAYLAAATGDTLRLYETRSGRQVQEWRFPAEIRCLSFAAGAAPTLAVGLANGSAELWR